MAFSLLCISVLTFENLFCTMGWYYTIVTGQLFPCKNRRRNQGISCSWWCLWFSCGVAGTSTSQFFRTISAPLVECFSEWMDSKVEDVWKRLGFNATVPNEMFCWILLSVSSRMVRHYITPWWCSYLSHVFHCLIVEVLRPTKPFCMFLFWNHLFWTIHWCIVFGPPRSLHGVETLISKASSETKMWWWQVHSRCSLEHWCLVLRHWQRHLGSFKFNYSFFFWFFKDVCLDGDLPEVDLFSTWPCGSMKSSVPQALLRELHQYKAAIESLEALQTLQLSCLCWSGLLVLSTAG